MRSVHSIFATKCSKYLLVAWAYLEGGRGGRPPIAHEIFALFKYQYPNIGKDTSELHHNSTKSVILRWSMYCCCGPFTSSWWWW